MSKRWQHKVVEVPVTMFGGKLVERTQEALDKLGPQGWELVSVAHSNSFDTLRLFLKREA